MLTIYGVLFSAHTRKVLVGARLKGLSYELSPLVPIGAEPPAWFHEASPLGKIPVLRHEGRMIADSSVIALYLDRVFPDRPLFPTPPEAYARALFIEELVDGALAPHVLHGLLFQRVFAPKLLKQEPDEALVAYSLREAIPPRLSDLEARLTGDWFADTFSYADITVASMLLNFHYAGEQLDAARWPRLAAFLRRALCTPPFVEALSLEAPAARDLGALDTRLLDELGY